jgi:hypothetical protein
VIPSISFAPRPMGGRARSIAWEHGCGVGSRLRQRPASQRRARRARLLPASWRARPISRAIRPASSQRRRDKPAGGRQEEARLDVANSFRCSRCVQTSPQPDSRRLLSRRHRALRAVPGQTEHETAHGLFSGSEAHSRQNPRLLCALTSR